MPPLVECQYREVVPEGRIGELALDIAQKRWLGETCVVIGIDGEASMSVESFGPVQSHNIDERIASATIYLAEIVGKYREVGLCPRLRGFDRVICAVTEPGGCIYASQGAKQIKK